jgi:DNA-binding MarR family transcriptional regulator
MSEIPGDLPRLSSPRLRAALDVNLQLLDVADRLRAHWNATARSYGLSGVQIKLLLSLAADETLTMRSLAGRLRYDASNLTTLVDRLEHDGLIQRSAHPTDRRVTEVRLTPDGRRIRDEFWIALNSNGPLDPLTSNQLKKLRDALSHVLQSPQQA